MEKPEYCGVHYCKKKPHETEKKVILNNEPINNKKINKFKNNIYTTTLKSKKRKSKHEETFSDNL